jgi:hypothetical protein
MDGAHFTGLILMETTYCRPFTILMDRMAWPGIKLYNRYRNGLLNLPGSGQAFLFKCVTAQECMRINNIRIIF